VQGVSQTGDDSFFAHRTHWPVGGVESKDDHEFSTTRGQAGGVGDAWGRGQGRGRGGVTGVIQAHVHYS